jgi:hypothetical protein
MAQFWLAQISLKSFLQWITGISSDFIRIAMSKFDPLPPVVNGGIEASKIANFPKNEHWC